MELSIENISLSLSKYEKKSEKSPDFIGNVYNHLSKEKVLKAFGRLKEWPNGDKYIHVTFKEIEESISKNDNKKTLPEDDLPF